MKLEQRRIRHFSRRCWYGKAYQQRFSRDLINWVSAQSLYKPNEAELKVTALQAYLAKLKKANKDVTDAEPIY
jgi:hypothetical protein